MSCTAIPSPPAFPQVPNLRCFYRVGNGLAITAFGSTQPFLVVADEQVPGLLVFLYSAETTDPRIVENIVGIVVVDSRNFADEDVAALAPERVPVLVGHQRDAFARLELEVGT